MPSLPMLRAPLAANAPAHPLDVVWLKSALQALGHYQAPDWGISPYPDRALFDAVRAFQDDRGLAADGSLKPGGATWSALTDRLDGEAGPQTLRAAARALQSLGRGGDTILAHITVEEARLLKTLGGSGTVNPATGLMEFWGRLGGSKFERERAAKDALRESSTTRALEKRQRSGDWDATRGRTLGYNDFNPGGLHGDKNRDGSPKDAEGLDRHKRAVEQNEAKALAKAGVHALPERLYAHATITPTDPRRRRGKGLNADATMAMHFGLGGDGELFTQVSEERPQDLDTFGIETLGEAAFTKTPDKAEQARIAGRILGLADEPGQRTLKSHATLSGPSLSSMTAATGPEAQPKPSSKPKPKTTRTVSPAHQALMDRVNAKIAANRARVKNYLVEADAMKASGLKMTADNRKAAWTKAAQNLLDYEAEAWGAGPIRVPVLKNEEERLLSNINDTPAIFYIEDNPNANGGYRIHEFSWLGKDAVEEHNDTIEKMATKHDVDPDIVRAVMWAENARGHWGIGNKLADAFRVSDTPMPMNMNKETGAKLLGVEVEDLYTPEVNIEAGTIMLKRIIDRVEDPTDISKIGSVWNFTGRELTNDFGEYIERLYTEKPWSQ